MTDTLSVAKFMKPLSLLYLIALILLFLQSLLLYIQWLLLFYILKPCLVQFKLFDSLLLGLT